MIEHALKFSSKAETLQTLYGALTTASIKPPIIFTVGEWDSDKEKCLDSIQNDGFSSSTKLIIRSSATTEDSQQSSHAGEYLSVAEILSSDRKGLREGVEKVIDSYPDRDQNHQFFLQEFVKDIEMSGVLLTRTLDINAPYYVLNYDLSGSHDSITSGYGKDIKTYIRFRDSKYSAPDKRIDELLRAAGELEQLFQNDSLDIEFAIDKEGTLYILQVRPIAQVDLESASDSSRIGLYLEKIDKKIKKLTAPHPGIYGSSALYSVMTDWNPAEIIGVKPRALALSLYKRLVTDSIWAYQRNNYGYKNLRGFPLLISLFGHPYIDVRASISSFIPKGLDEALSHKLADYYINKLKETPSDHDKVEFNIVFSCYYLGINTKLAELTKHGFTELEVDRIKFALLDVTNTIISKKNGLFEQDLKKVQYLEKRLNDFRESQISLIDRIYWLVQDCARYGTLPFAGLARGGFIAVQFLQSFVDLEIITKEQYQKFMASLNTVAKQLARDTNLLSKGALSKEDFLKSYGHLRPGTYDILSQRYDEGFDTYFGKIPPVQDIHEEQFSFSEEQKEKIDYHLTQNGLQMKTDELISFIKAAIEGREYGKFIFTKHLSEILVLIEKLGDRFEISKEEMSHINLGVILDLYASLNPVDVKDVLIENICNNKKGMELTSALCLPQFISRGEDAYHFHMADVEPNFVTDNKITNFVVVEEEIPNIDIQGKIVCIKSADPGYDWIFSKDIGGLITMYGGANSHMAIRCAELKIPAIIGCGEQNFDTWTSSDMLELDCSKKAVKVIR